MTSHAVSSPRPVPTLFTVPVHPSVPADAQRDSFFVGQDGGIYMPGNINTAPSRSTTSTNRCNLTVSFYQILPDSGQLVRILRDNFLVEATFDPAYGSGSSCGTQGGLTAVVDDVAGWLYYAVVAVISGADVGGASYYSVLLVRRIKLVGATVSSSVLRSNLTDSNPLSVFQQGFLPSGIALSGPADSSTGASYVLLAPYGDGYNAYAMMGAAVAVDLSGNGVVRARPSGLGLAPAAWAVDGYNGAYDMYLLYKDTSLVDPKLCDPLTTSTQMNGQLPCFNYYIARDIAGATAAAISKWPTVIGWSGAMAAAPGVDVEVVPFQAFIPTSGVANPVISVVGSRIYLTDPYRCQIQRVDGISGNVGVSAGYAVGLGGPGRARPVCSRYPTDGPALDRPIGAPGRLVATSAGSLVFHDVTTNLLRRLARA
ncbi:hypothetical protein HYH03_001199 [Edaphochlamys debaryana]|uniref:Uncharacterized protein n=1 Tax=Edaphochlamys debaryana TaxID=47281 RepID=A0A836C5N9_9CHLO|nr:hypothetical protein HYH03_001199 [Edaphochlamys debaryana]|eukprot:KAG2501416.1 hypothetical protein HYH03_001199 [Edaphochlamys debaryana]